jgi:hypothetical protein
MAQSRRDTPRVNEPRANAVPRDRPVLVGALLAAGLLVVLVLWFGRACFGGWWVAPGPTSDDTYMLATIYERWAVQVKGGHLPLWFPEFGAGYPVHAAWMYGLFYPPIALFMVLPPEAAWTWLAILHVVFGALGMYAFLWDDRRDAAAAACGAIVFALSGFMLQRILAGHMNLVMPMAWAPWVLLAATRTARGEPRAAAWLGLATGVGLLAGHVQVWFYVGPLVAAFAVMETTRRRAWRAAAPRLALAAAIAVGIAAIQWLPAWELFSVTGHPAERREVIESCSATPAALAAQIAPRFAGANMPLAHEFVGLAGPIAVAAALLAFRLRDRRRWFWFATLAVGLVLATGLRTDLGRLANELPPFRFARAPGRAMTLVVTAGSVLAAQLVADWLGALPGRLRALAPPAFVASALLFGSPGPDVVKRDFYEYDWTQPTPAARNHRIHVGLGRYPYVERFGARTLRSVCPVDPPTFTAMSPPATSPDVAAWWFDVGLELDMPTDGARGDLQAIAARSRRHESTPGGALQTFAEAVRVSDDEALRRLRTGERALFLAPETIDASWRATDVDALRRVRVEPSDDPDRVALVADAPCAGPVFVSQRWYPGWETSPPGRLARGNVAFLAAYVDFPTAGTVEIRYRPWWRVPALTAGAASLALAAWLVVRRGRGASTFSRTDGAS